VATMAGLFADILFLGVNGIHAQSGLTCFSSDEADINRAMVRQAKRKIAVADHRKLGVVAKWLICPIEAIDMLITDNGATKDQVAPFLDRGIKVHQA
jgi:DeoR/GlpR family transcriptional regulator of sugar metabolism